MSNTHWPMPLVAFYSDYPQAGKSTLAGMVSNALAEKGHAAMLASFADPVKEMTFDLLSNLGVEKAYRYVYGDSKDEVVNYGLTGREFQQLLGTQFGRHLLHENVWVDALATYINRYVDPDRPVLIDDLRMKNELVFVSDPSKWGVFGYFPYRVYVERPSVAREPGHETDGALLGFKDICEAHVINDADLDALEVEAEKLAGHILLTMREQVPEAAML